MNDWTEARPPAAEPPSEPDLIAPRLCRRLDGVRERAIAAAISARVEATRPAPKGHARGTTDETASTSTQTPERRKRP